jgi:hypothetical protein
MPAGDTGDLIVSLSEQQTETLRNVWSLVHKAAIDHVAAAELAVRLADPLLGIRVRYRPIAELLGAAVGVEVAIEGLRRYQPADQPSQEIRDCLMGVLLLEQGRLDEARVQIHASVATARYYRGDVLTLAAWLARREANPDSALDYAEAALKLNPNLRQARNIVEWALVKLGRLEKSDVVPARENGEATPPRS